MRRTLFFIVACLFAATSHASIPRVNALALAREDAPALLAPLSETRVWASDNLAPFEHQPPSALTRALHQAYGDSSTTSASGLRCFLSVDPGPVHPERPQSWNRYSYVSNNPITYFDPTGREQRFNASTYNWAGFLSGLDRLGRALDRAAPVAAMAITAFEVARGVIPASAGVQQIEEEAAEITAVESEAAVAESKMAGSIRTVNPTGSQTNCVNCAATVDNMLATGRQASALPGGPKPISSLGTNWMSMGSQEKVASTIAGAGNGARGIVYVGTGKAGSVGHVFNVVNQNGVVRFLDGQTGKAVTWLKEWTDVRLLR